MSNETHVLHDLKLENRNRIYNAILRNGSVSRQDLVYELKLSLPTITQNLNILLEQNLITESGSFGHTGGRRAKAYSICEQARVAIGLDISKNHITVVVINLTCQIIYRKRIRFPFQKDDTYLQKLGALVNEAIETIHVTPEQIQGVGIVVPGLITRDGQKIFYGEILHFTGMTCNEFSKYISYPCRLFNDADAAGYAEAYMNKDISDSFYISLSNNIGGSIIIDGKVYKGEGPRSGEVGHITIVPNGRKCYCGQYGCFETYCNAALLSDYTNGNLEEFFLDLQNGNLEYQQVWNEYLHFLSIAVNNVRMLFDCQIILGGYVGAYIEPYMDTLRQLVAQRNSFEDNADFLHICKVKQDALAVGGALPFIHDFIKNI